MSLLTTNICEELKIMFLPDVHTGHPRIKPTKLHEHFIKFVYPKLEDINILVIGGDFFHTLLSMNSDAGIMAAIIIDELIMFSHQYQFYIRVVRGTFSHDRFQNRFFTVRDGGNDTLWDKPRVRVLDSIDIELLPKWDISIMYCPDDQPTKDLTGTLVETMDAQGVDKVDFLCSHGYFEHLLPTAMDHIPSNTIMWNSLKNRVQGCVLNGHVHFHCLRNRVVSGGSLERFAHGEEEPKGYYIITYNLKDRKVSKYDFVENTLATPFVTIDSLKYPCVEECFKYVDGLIEKYRSEVFQDPEQEIYLCIIGEDSVLGNYIKTTYHNVFVKHKSVIVQKVLDVDVDTSYNDLPKITKQNLPDLVWERIKSKLSTKLPNVEFTFDEVKDILDDDA